MISLRTDKLIQKILHFARIIYLPLLLTTIRLASVPFILWCIIMQYWVTAFVLFICAGITDILDGFLARVLQQETMLGSYLDPLADKILMIGVLLIGAYQGFVLQLVPCWLIWLICIKELFFVGVSGVYFLWAILNNKSFVRARPHVWGKLANFFEILLISFVFIYGFESLPLVATLILYCAYIVALLNLCATFFYSKRLLIESKIMKRMLCLCVLICSVGIYTVYSMAEEVPVVVLKKKEAKKKNKHQLSVEYCEQLEQLVHCLREEMKELLQYEGVLFDELSSVIHEDDSNTVACSDAKGLTESVRNIAELVKESKERVQRIKKSKDL